MNPTARDLLETALKAGGYDGLVNSRSECACLLGDLAPCEADPLQCIAGYKVEYAEGACPCGMGCKFHVVAEKPAEVRPDILPCPECGSTRVGVLVLRDFYSIVRCYACDHAGLSGNSYVETVRVWNEAAEAAR